MRKNTAILLIHAPDQKGITARVTGFISSHGGNIVHADQHIDDQSNTFFMRVEFSLDDFILPENEIEAMFTPMAREFQMSWDLYYSAKKVRMAIFVSRHLHCLRDLLGRHHAGQLDCDIPLVIGNHPDAEHLVRDYGIRYETIPVTSENKAAQEKKELALLREENIDLIVLARYHQILTEEFIAAFSDKIINIHHSFLPAFVGANPYAQAYRKGVKVIGATSHFVTAELDQGPIIAQDTAAVSHRDTLEDFMRKGEDLERMVLNEAVRAALQRKILRYENKTVIFE